jgi:hypothetical protein
MDEQTVRTHADRFIEALHAVEQNDGDAENEINALVELFADDAHLTNAALRLTNEEKQGRDAIHSFWRDYKKSLGKARSEFSQVTVNGEAAGLFWRTEATNANGNASYDGATLLVFNAEGKIRHFSGYYDTRQLGKELTAKAQS